MKGNSLLWPVAIAGVVLDQGSKIWIMAHFLEVGSTWPLWPGVFHLTYVLNTGAAFSLFRGGVDWLKWLSLLVSMSLIFLAYKTPRLTSLEQLGYGAILAGAIGNGIDRFRLGHVVDFLDFRLINFPVFNWADVWINVGMGALILAHLPLLRPRV